LKFLQWCNREYPPSGMRHCFAGKVVSDISEERVALKFTGSGSQKTWIVWILGFSAVHILQLRTTERLVNN